MSGGPSPGSSGRWLVPVAITANALALLLFRHFVSLDGPMHLLHAAVQRDAWSGVTRQAEGMWVDARALDLSLGDLLLIPLSGALHPFLLHKLLATLAVTCVCAGAWRLAKAYRSGVNAAWLLVLPCSVGFTLVLGLFHFIIASGIVFALLAWWVALKAINWRQLGLLLGGCALCTFAHKAGGALLLLLLGMHEAVLRLSAKNTWQARWSALPRWFMPSAIAVLVSLAAVLLLFRFSTSPVHPHEPHRPLRELFTLRQLVLLDSVAERPFRVAIGLAFIALGALALRQRRRTRALLPGDALLASALLLLLLSLIRTPKTELLYITDRAQGLAFLLIACWLGVQELPARAVLLVGLCVLGVHALRLVLMERRMQPYEARDQAVMVAARSFEPGALVVPVVLDDDWLARHRTAYAAIAHRGLVFTGRDHLRITWDTPPDVPVRNYLYSLENNWAWIGQHIRKGTRPTLRQVLVVGTTHGRSDKSWIELKGTLSEFYRPTDTTASVGVWTLKEAH